MVDGVGEPVEFDDEPEVDVEAGADEPGVGVFEDVACHGEEDDDGVGDEV